MEEQPSKETLEQWHKDPDNWILGIFYFNKKDKRLLMPKRISMLGWTVNFANPYSLLCLTAIILMCVLLSNFKIDTV